jgi:hypothetical protein
MQLEVRELISLGAGILILAGLSMAVINGDKTAKILGTGFSGFGNLVRAATLR